MAITTLSASSVSRFLTANGFTRSKALPSRVRGYRRYTDGFQVRMVQGVVEIEMVGFTGESLIECLEAVTVSVSPRWSVTLDQRGMSQDSRYLKITAK